MVIDEAEALLKSFEAAHGKCEKGTPQMDKLRKFVESFGVKKLGEIPAASYDDAMARIKTI